MEGAELLRIIDASHREKDIDREALFDGIETALLAAAQKQYGTTGEIAVTIDRETGGIRAYEETPEGQVHMKDLDSFMDTANSPTLVVSHEVEVSSEKGIAWKARPGGSQ